MICMSCEQSSSPQTDFWKLAQNIETRFINFFGKGIPLMSSIFFPVTCRCAKYRTNTQNGRGGGGADEIQLQSCRIHVVFQLAAREKKFGLSHYLTAQFTSWFSGTEHEIIIPVFLNAK